MEVSMTEPVTNQIVWCDIPVKDLDRAMRFYGAVLGASLKKDEFPGGMAMAVLPHVENSAGGCLVQNAGEPSRQGPLVYLNAQGRLDAAIKAVAANGGSVLEAKHQIGPHGFRAIVLDSEGNRIALHSM
jgi:hypothetical protein